MEFWVGYADRCCWNAELFIWFGTIISAIPKPKEASEPERSGTGERFPPRCFSAILLIPDLSPVCVTEERQHTEQKARVFREQEGRSWESIQYARQDGPTSSFLKKRFPWASFNSQFQTDWQPRVDERSRSRSITIQLQLFKTQLILPLTFPSSCKVPVGKAIYFDFEFLLGRLTENGFGLNSCTEHILFYFVAISNNNT